ncbi:MAG TPA: hypothetical protein VGR67_13460 [Candidatus Polarisedimenticolia bacterium]|jgi:hypothetical protein|nr:hypothetical protein [Candidatus Polarisedimenticolia bacterium]
MSRIPFRISLGLAFAAVWWAAGGAPALALSCGELRLMDASGVLGPLQRYTVTAHCSKEYKDWSKTEVAGFDVDKNSKYDSISLKVLGKASWDRKTGEATEQLLISGDAEGKRFVRGNCNQDPFLRDAPGAKVSCDGMNAQYEAKSGPVYDFFLAPRFYLAKKISLAEAQGLSANKGPGNAPPPPPAPGPSPKPGPAGPPAAPKTMKSPSGAQMWEGETLLRNRKYLVAGGKLSNQPMAGFGPDWSGDAHLLWTEGAVGAVLDLVIDVTKRGAYRVSLGLTQGPDFGIIDAEVNGEKSSMKFDGYSPTVKRVDLVELGTFNLNAGPRKIALMIIGKNSQSTNFLVGVDRVMLTPVK